MWLTCFASLYPQCLDTVGTLQNLVCSEKVNTVAEGHEGRGREDEERQATKRTRGWRGAGWWRDPIEVMSDIHQTPVAQTEHPMGS